MVYVQYQKWASWAFVTKTKLFTLWTQIFIVEKKVLLHQIQSETHNFSKNPFLNSWFMFFHLKALLLFTSELRRLRSRFWASLKELLQNKLSNMSPKSWSLKACCYIMAALWELKFHIWTPFFMLERLIKVANCSVTKVPALLQIPCFEIPNHYSKTLYLVCSSS